MTVIAWDGRTVAADSQVTYGSTRGSKPFEKLRRVGDAVYGLTGTGALFDAMVRWVADDGANPEKKPAVSEEHANTQLIVWRDGRCFSYTVAVPYPEEHFAPQAWGIAADHVIGAMDSGIDATTAVLSAIRREVYLGGPVLAIDLGAIETPPAAKKRGKLVVV